MEKYVGILTAGGDTPGLNAALRGLGKSAHGKFNMQLIGFFDGFNGLLHDRSMNLDEAALSGIITMGGTILGTSREKPHKRECCRIAIAAAPGAHPSGVCDRIAHEKLNRRIEKKESVW